MKNVHIEPIDQDEDFPIYLQRFNMPFLITNRAFFNTTYLIEGSEPGEFTYIVSSLGNRAFETKHADKVRSDVLGKINMNYLGIRPLKDPFGDVVGTQVQQV